MGASLRHTPSLKRAIYRRKSVSLKIRLRRIFGCAIGYPHEACRLVRRNADEAFRLCQAHRRLSVRHLGLLQWALLPSAQDCTGDQPRNGREGDAQRFRFRGSGRMSALMRHRRLVSHRRALSPHGQQHRACHAKHSRPGPDDHHGGGLFATMLGWSPAPIKGGKRSSQIGHSRDPIDVDRIETGKFGHQPLVGLHHDQSPFSMLLGELSPFLRRAWPLPKRNYSYISVAPTSSKHKTSRCKRGCRNSSTIRFSPQRLTIWSPASDPPKVAA